VVRKLLTAVVAFGTTIPNCPSIITLFGCFQCFGLPDKRSSTVFCSSRLQELSTSSEENPDYSDIELIQYINVDVSRLTRLLNG
jgi:hypothetical protein